MKFYLCQTPAGPQLAATQADAKKLDPKFETVDYETDKDSLMKRLNDLMTAAAGNAPQPAEIEDEEPAPEPAEKAKKGVEDTSATDDSKAPPEGSCPRCVAMSAAARKIEGIMAITNVEHTIYHADVAFLKRVDIAIDERMKELG